MDEPKINQIAVVVVLALVVVGGIVAYLTLGKEGVKEQTSENTASVATEQYILVGKVTFVIPETKTFTFDEARTGTKYTVVLGSETSFIQTIFPEVITPDFSPERRNVTINDLSPGDQVSVRSEKLITSLGEDIVNPKEVHILP